MIIQTSKPPTTLALLLALMILALIKADELYCHTSLCLINYIPTVFTSYGDFLEIFHSSNNGYSTLLCLLTASLIFSAYVNILQQPLNPVWHLTGSRDGFSR